MSKKAFCVGINDYPYENSDLKGCVNDAYAWAELLISHFDFARPDVKIITNNEATKKNLINGIKNLVTGAKPGDVLVFTNSSHGSYKADGVEDEEYDEVICPYDIEDNLLLDDELRLLFIEVHEGVRLTVICDSCHSGTITRVIPGIDDRRMRFLHPSLRGDLEVEDPWRARPKRLKNYPQSKMKEILIAGCTDIELSYDARFGQVYHGAMSYFALQAIRNAEYELTYTDLIKRVRRSLTKARFPQHPQLEGNKKNKSRQIFT